MLTVEVKVNGLRIASASAHNVSKGDEIGDYLVAVIEAGSPFNNGGLFRYGKITGHNRRQSAWALVEKIAALASKDQTDAPR